MKKGLTEILFILDASGSMYGFTEDTIGGFNSLIEKQKNLDGAANVSLVTFSNNVKDVYTSKPLTDVKELTEKEYIASGMTALYDAVGLSIAKLEGRISDLPEEEKPQKVMIVITTDGYENASKEYNQHSIKNILENKEKEGWEVIFVGANIDTSVEGEKIGLDNKRTANYKATAGGMSAMYDALNFAVMSVRDTGELNEDWAAELNNDDEE